MRKRLNEIASNLFSKCVANLPSPTQTAPKSEIDFRTGAISKTGSSSSGGTHIAILEPCCWKWHSSKLQTSTSFLFANLRRFFKSFLIFWICMGNKWTRLTKPKTQLIKKSLALANPKRNIKCLHYKIRQQFTIPKVLFVTVFFGRLPQSFVYCFNLLRSQSFWASRFIAIFKSSESIKINIFMLH